MTSRLLSRIRSVGFSQDGRALRKQVENLNQRLNDLTWLVFDQAWETDANFRFTSVSDGVLDALAWRPIDILGRRFSDVGRFEEDIGVDQCFWHTPFRDALFETRDAQSQTRHFLVSGFPVLDSVTGAFAGVFGIANDVSERTRFESEWGPAEAVLERRVRDRTQSLQKTNNELRAAKEAADLANRSKSEFLANMSHELRTPLNAIIGFSDFIREGYAGDMTPKQREFIEDIHESGDHLLNLINDVLDLSKIELQGVEIGDEEVDLAECVQGCLRLLRERLERANLRLHTSGLSDLRPVRVDRRKFKQVVLNLLSNSVKFTEPGGFITVSGRETLGGGYCLAVSDTGIGMSESEIETAISVFGQVDAGEGRALEGSGLGLPIVKSLIEAHGGKLEIRSRPGSGTTVSIHIPSERVVPRVRAAG